MDEVEQWVEKIKGKGADLSLEEDLSIGLMNLVSLEEHFYFSAMKTKDDKYLTLLNETREMRKKFLARLVINPQGEEWCISKHLLAASMRLYEVGTKELSNGNKESANGFFEAAFELHSTFFAINLGLLESKPVSIKPPTKSVMASVSEFLKKAIDCCKE